MLQSIAEKDSMPISAQAESRIKRSSQKYLIYYNKLSPIVYSSIEDSGVLLTVRHLTELRKRRSRDECITEDILEEFSKHKDIDFAYPTHRYYNNITEGKEKFQP